MALSKKDSKAVAAAAKAGGLSSSTAKSIVKSINSSSSSNESTYDPSQAQNNLDTPRGVGGTIDRNQPVVATTSPDRAGFVQNSTKLDQIMATRGNIPLPVEDPNNPATGSGTGTGTGTSTTASKNQPKLTDGMTDPTTLELNRIADAEKRRKDEYKKLLKVNDATFNASVADIEQTYGTLAKKAETSNAQYMGQLNQAAYATNASRYTPQITAGTIYNAEQEGIQKLADIDSQQNVLIAKARVAKDQSDYAALQSYMDDYDDLEVQRTEALTAQYEKAKEIETALAEQERTSSRDNAVAGVVSQGVTDPGKILDLLNYDDKGNKTGDFTLEEVSKTLGFLKQPDMGTTGLFKFDAKGTATLLGNNISLSQVQAIQSDLNSGAPIDDVLGPDSGLTSTQVAAVKAALGVNTAVPTTPGVGARDSVDEQIIRTRLFSQLAGILNKGALSDSDRETINNTISTFRDAGMGEQEILDRVSGFPSETQSPYNVSFRNAIISNSDTPEQRTNKITQVGSLLSTGDYVGAMNAIENTAYDKAKKTDEDGYMGPQVAGNVLSKVENVRKILADNGYNGPITGTFEQLLGKLKSSEATKLQAAVASLVAPIRNQLSGTAVTDSEARFLEPLIPDLKDKTSNFTEKLNALERGTLGQFNSTRQSVGLPVVNTHQVLKPAERLNLYSSKSSSGIFGNTKVTETIDLPGM